MSARLVIQCVKCYKCVSKMRMKVKLGLSWVDEMAYYDELFGIDDD